MNSFCICQQENCPDESNNISSWRNSNCLECLRKGLKMWPENTRISKRIKELINLTYKKDFEEIING